MALEKSVLTHDVIRSIVHNHYGLEMSACRRLPIGSANCYRVDTEERSYFLKEFQSTVTSDAVIREAALTEYLSKNGFRAALFMKNTNGQPFTVYGGHIISLEDYIEGVTYGYNDFPSKLLPDCARTLGLLHSVMKNYSLPIDMGNEWLEFFSAEALSSQYCSLAKKAAAMKENEKTEKIISSLKYKAELALRCEKYKKHFDKITYSPTHGDYQGCQLICDDNKIKAVVDFSSARTLPAVWEIMRSFVQTSDSRRTRRINISELSSYVFEYMKSSELTKDDLMAMPYVYLFQLARSKFGYSQYLLTDSEDRDGLINFALWRTDICRELEEKAEEISSNLKSII